METNLPTTGLYLKTDADICQVFKSLLGKIPNRSYQHVKGHQDTEKEADNLTIEAQLNVQADELATIFYWSNTTETQQAEWETIPRMTAHSVQLINNHGVTPRFITARVKDHLRNAALTPDLRAYMIEKYVNWNQKTPEMIN